MATNPRPARRQIGKRNAGQRIELDPTRPVHKIGVTVPMDLMQKVVEWTGAVDMSVGWFFVEAAKHVPLDERGLPVWFPEDVEAQLSLDADSLAQQRQGAA